jgi:hypothetical protein
MKEGDLPRDMSLHFSVSQPHRAQIILLDPVEIPYSPRYKTFWIHVPGVTITMNVGPNVPIETHMFCFWKNSAHVMMISDEVTSILERHFASQYMEARKTRSFIETRSKHRPSRK